jgi:hypothetical protein
MKRFSHAEILLLSSVIRHAPVPLDCQAPGHISNSNLR